MDRFLLLKFTDAGIYYGTGDKSIDVRKKKATKRNGNTIFKEPITIFQVSNVLHTIFGERPVSSVRDSLYPRVEYYFEKAGDSYLKIDTPKYKNKRTDEYEYPSEFIQTKKASAISWNPDLYWNWDRVFNYFDQDQEYFKGFIRIVDDLLGVESSTYSFNDVRKMILDVATTPQLKEYDTFVIEAKKLKYLSGNFNNLLIKKVTWNTVKDNFKTKVKGQYNYDNYDMLVDIISRTLGYDASKKAFVNVVLDLNTLTNKKIAVYEKYLTDNMKGLMSVKYLNGTQINQYSKRAYTVNNGIGRVVKLSGKMLIPVSDEDIERLRNSRGTSTILDGGLVTIEGVYYGNEIPNDNYIKVSDITTERNY